MKKILYLDIIIFFAAFLLFQIELIISKILLVKFGGTYTVWGAALVFFQGTLFLGYLYSHLAIKKFGMFKYRYLHLGLLFLTLLFFPGRPLPFMQVRYQIPMVINIFWQLLCSIGPVFFVLSTTSIIFQSWLAKSELPEKANPYALYAISNLGSFAGLLTYPFIFERFFGLDTQLNIWRVVYFILLVFHLIAFKAVIVRKGNEEAGQILYNIGFKEKLRWFILGAAGVIMFLSVTNIITYEVLPMPLLWIIPLCIYLVSFVLSFKKSPWCPPAIKDKLHIIIAYSILLFFFSEKRSLPVVIEIVCYSILLFMVCMFCQSELNKRKPSDSRNLTIFYLLISGGGFIGGILVSWVIPLISNLMIEYLVGLFIIYLALIIDEENPRFDIYSLRLIIYFISFIMLWPVLFKGYNIFGLIIILMIFKLVFSELKTKPLAIGLSLLSIICLSPLLDSLWSRNIYTYRHRNYYGIYKIFERNDKRFLLSGAVIQGAQYMIKEKQKEPLAYFHYSTPIGKTMTSDLFNFDHIGIIGLGTGTLAAYGKTGQVIDFFELDPDVFHIADKYFTYLKRSSSKINYIFGDARLSMVKMPDKYYDLLVIDAFSGDSIPIHLLTTEAISEYLRHITDEGIILFHISNNYAELRPVLFSNANVMNLYACYDYNLKSKNRDATESLWFALTGNPNTFKKLTSQLKWHKLHSKSLIKNMRPWTDQYSDILLVLDIANIIDKVKEFKLFYWDIDTLGGYGLAR